MAYRNSEGYKDPTAGEAMGNIMREYRAQRRQTWRRQYELRCRSKVYIVSRYARDKLSRTFSSNSQKSHKKSARSRF